MDSSGYYDYDNSMMNGMNFDYGMDFSQPMWNNYGSSYNYMPNEYNIPSYNYEHCYDQFQNFYFSHQVQSQEMSFEDMVKSFVSNMLQFQENALQFQKDTESSIKNIEQQLGQLTSDISEIKAQFYQDSLCQLMSPCDDDFISEDEELENDLILNDEVEHINTDLELEEPFHPTVIDFEKKGISCEFLEECQVEVKSNPNALQFDICHDNFNIEHIDFVMPYNIDGLCFTDFSNLNLNSPNCLIDDFMLEIKQEDNELIVYGKQKLKEIKMDDVDVHDREGIG